MARRSRLQIVAPDIAATFEANPQRVFSQNDLRTVLDKLREPFDLPTSTTVASFARFLEDEGKLSTVELQSSYGSRAHRYVWGAPSVFGLALSLKSGSYLSHGTAAYLHGLTEEVPKTLYVNREQSPKPRPTGTLTQEGIDRAFGHQQRTSQLSYEYGMYKIVVLSGMNTGNLEVGTLDRPIAEGTGVETLRVTKLERTLIDVTVRPNYAGGVTAVLENYRKAKDRVSIATLVATLKKLGFVYPFHQAIGFYMSRAGYEPSRLERLRALGLNYDFYLTYGLPAPNYDSTWRIRFPQGI